MPGSIPKNITGHNKWYHQPNPDEYAYTPGYGFFDKPPCTTEKELLRRYAFGLSAAVLGYTMLSAFIPVLISGAVRAYFPGASLILNDNSGVYYIITSLTFILSMTIPFAIYCQKIGIPRKAAVPADKLPGLTFVIPAVGVGLGLSVIGRYFMTLPLVFFPYIGLEPVPSEVYLPSSPTAFFMCAISLTVVPAFLEEFIVRGVIMQSLRRFGDGFALLTSSLIFMLLHKNIIQYSNALLMGLFIGYCVIYTGCVWTGVAIHFVNNLSVLMIITLQKYSGISNETLYAVYCLFLIIALISVAFMIKKNPRLFRISPPASYNTPSALIKLFFSTPSVVLMIILLLSVSIKGIRFIA